MKIKNITVRVYGLLIHEGSILLSHERIQGKLYTKFPGGGLEIGESIVDCLKREFMEEVGVTVEPTGHFYTTEDLVVSAFAPNVQVLSIYYKVRTSQINQIPIAKPEELITNETLDQVLFWSELNKIDPEDIELPIDKLVVSKLLRL